MVFEHSRKKIGMRDSIDLHLNVKNKQGHRLDKEKETHAPCNVQSWKVSEITFIDRRQKCVVTLISKSFYVKAFKIDLPSSIPNSQS
jgi:hypothetical protein